MTDPTMPPIVAKFIDAINRNDATAFLDAFPENGEVDDWGTRYDGRAAIRTWSDREFIGVKVSLTVVQWTWAGQRVDVVAEVGGNGFNGPSTFSFALGGDHIRRMRIRSVSAPMSWLSDLKGALTPAKRG